MALKTASYRHRGLLNYKVESKQWQALGDRLYVIQYSLNWTDSLNACALGIQDWEGNMTDLVPSKTDNTQLITQSIVPFLNMAHQGLLSDFHLRQPSMPRPLGEASSMDVLCFFLALRLCTSLPLPNPFTPPPSPSDFSTSSWGQFTLLSASYDTLL